MTQPECKIIRYDEQVKKAFLKIPADKIPVGFTPTPTISPTPTPTPAPTERTFRSYSGGVFYGSGGTKFLEGDGISYPSNMLDLGLTLVVAGVAATNDNWLTSTKSGELINQGNYSFSNLNVNFRDDGYGLARIGWINIVNGVLADDSLDQYVSFKTGKDGPIECARLTINQTVNVWNSGFRLRLLLTEYSNGGYLDGPHTYAIEIFKPEESGLLSVKDSLFAGMSWDDHSEFYDWINSPSTFSMDSLISYLGTSVSAVWSLEP